MCKSCKREIPQFYYYLFKNFASNCSLHLFSNSSFEIFLIIYSSQLRLIFTSKGDINIVIFFTNILFLFILPKIFPNISDKTFNIFWNNVGFSTSGIVPLYSIEFKYLTKAPLVVLSTSHSSAKYLLSISSFIN